MYSAATRTSNWLSTYNSSSPLEIPRVGRVLGAGEPSRRRLGNSGQRFGRLPGVLKSCFERFHRNLQPGQEFLVCAMLAIRRLFGWHQEQSLHEADVEVHQETPVKQNPVTPPALGIAGEF